ncbi:hypothetical protein PRK78_006225 [Emydomyces testavorans]|uniref:Centrosomin N-terminal motif 1 domain-containing protein n=1 Tax=Emydomyces testavorans TaxID=2070801 RepID=A0AAF0DLM0_9EURO|nr:hypothetical protein PRK78_006225 [Emydomyces testavorans]
MATLPLGFTNQELRKEQRAVRGSRPPVLPENASDGLSTANRVDSSQSGSALEKNHKLHNALSAGLKEATEMGVREMDQYVSKINKEIFDLKLEIVHRAKQMDAMKQKLERMAELEARVLQLEAVQTELQDANAKLRQDIEKRNQGLYEAVGLICDLERTIKDIECKNEVQTSKPDPYRNEDLVLSTETLEEVQTPKNTPMIDVPDRSSSWKGTTSAKSRRSRISSSRHTRRQPSFLQDHSENTSVLRSIYIEDVNKPRALSIFSGHESEVLDSPRLSALSECSDLDPSLSPIQPSKPQMLNITSYADKVQHSDTETSRMEEDIDGKFSRIEEWIPPNASLHCPEGQTHTNREAQNVSAVSRYQPKLGPAFNGQHSSRGSKFEATGNETMFTGRLPPTPDTMSTSFIYPRNRSNQSIIVERSQYGRGHVVSSVTSADSVGRPTSAGNITTRPSTADTALLNGIESWNHGSLGNNGKSSLKSLYTSTDRGHHVSDPRAGKIHLNEADLEKHDKNSTWTSANGNTNPVKHRHTPSTGPIPTDLALSDISGSRDVSNSDILTPQDWLEAALPIVKDTSTRRNTYVHENAEYGDSIGVHGPDEQLDAELPPLPTSRIRRNRLAPPYQKTSQTRRGLAFRLFGRSKSNNYPGPALAEKAILSSSTDPRSIRPNTARCHSVKFDSSSITQQSSRPRPLSTYSMPEVEITQRPRTSSSMENIKHNRRGSFGLFTWLKGPKSIHVPGKRGIRVFSQPSGRPDSAWGFASSSRFRPSSPLNPNIGGASSKESLTSQSRPRHPLAGEVTSV